MSGFRLFSSLLASATAAVANFPEGLLNLNVNGPMPANSGGGSKCRGNYRGRNMGFRASNGRKLARRIMGKAAK